MTPPDQYSLADEERHKAASAPSADAGPGQPGSSTPEARPEPPLANSCKIGFGSSLEGEEEEPSEYPSRRDLRRFHQDHVVGDFLEGGAPKSCGRKRIPNRTVDIWRSGRTDQPIIAGLKQCGSVWECTVCSRRKAEARGRDIERDIQYWTEEKGGAVYFLTLTIPHHRGHLLSEVQECIREAWRYVRSGGPWQRKKDEVGWATDVTATEYTLGSSGWHGHKHVVCCLEEELEEEEREELERWIYRRWARKVEAAWIDRRGGGRELRFRDLNYPSYELPPHHDPAFGRPVYESGEETVAVTLQEADADAGTYLLDMGLGREATGLTVKEGKGGSRTPFELLRDLYLWWKRYGEIKPQDVRKWAEWCRDMKGARHIVRGNDYDETIGRPEGWRPEEEAVQDPQDEEEDELLLRIGEDLWGVLRRSSAAGIDQLLDALYWHAIVGGRDLVEKMIATVLRNALEAESRTGCDPGRVGYMESEKLYYLRDREALLESDQSWAERTVA